MRCSRTAARLAEMSAWSFARRKGGCSACGRAFAEGERHLSALRIAGEEIAREDHCRECWSAQAERESLIWWRTRHAEPRTRALALDLEALERLFLALQGRTEAALRELRYVLCLILMRKRRLVLVRIARDASGERLVVRRPRRSDELEVEVFDFSPERIEEVRAKLREVLEGAEGAAGSEEREDADAGESLDRSCAG